MVQVSPKQAERGDALLRLTNEITQTALSRGSIKEMLELLASRMVEILCADSCTISLWERDKQQFVAYTNVDPAGALCKPEDGAGQPGRHAFLSLSLKTGEENLGAILIEYHRPHPYISDEDGTRWEEIASHITLAITSIRSIEQEKQRRIEAELLQQAIVTITSSLDLQEVLDRILASLEQGVPFDSAAICLVEDDHYRIAAMGGSSRHTRSLGDTIGKSAGLFALLETSRSAVILADAQAHPSYEQWSEGGKVTIHGWMGVPLIAFDNLVGFLTLNGREHDVYTADHARVAQAFANHAAVAIENARLFEQVRNGRERLHLLSKKLVEIQEAERQYIAHELHDEIGQELTGLQFILEMGKEGAEERKLAALSEAQALVTTLMARVRELSLNLRPAMLDDLGLLPALKAHIERYQQQTGIQVHFQAENLEQRFSPEVENSAFRVVQEALTNVARYAWVSEIQASVCAEDSSLTIRVEDHGQGFDLALLKDDNRSFGIEGMRERTILAGGKFEIDSRPGVGTRVSAIFPTGQKLERRRRERKSIIGR